MVSKEEHIKGFDERLEGAVSEEKQKRYRNAVELYYKAMTHLIDYLLLSCPEEIIVDNLKQRLEELNKLDKEVTALFREAHGIYRGTYKSEKNIQDCRKLKNDIKTMAQLSGVKKAMQEGLKKLSRT